MCMGVVGPILWIALYIAAHAQPTKAQQLYECAVGCNRGADPSTSSADAVVGPAGVSPAAVTTAAAALQAAGIQVTGRFNNQLSLKLTKQQVSSAAVQQQCCYIVPSRPRTNAQAPLDTKQALRAMLGERLLAMNPSLNGTGIKVGLISDSYFETPLESGRQPSPCAAVNTAVVLRDFTSEADGLKAYAEGKAMAELICFIAPGVQFVFHTGFLGEAAMAQTIVDLATKEKCNIIVDDLYYSTEGEYSPGVLAQAVETAASQGVAYFGATGNMEGLAWEARARWVRVGDKTLHNFGTAARPDNFLEFRVIGDGENADEMTFQLQWNEPFFRYTNGFTGAATNLAMWWCPDQNLTPSCIVSDTDNNGDLSSPAQDPQEIINVPTKPTSTRYFLAIEHVDTRTPRTTAAAEEAYPEVSTQQQQQQQRQPPVLQLKLRWSGGPQAVFLPGGQNGNNANAPTLIPHVNTPGAMAIGAASYDATPGYNITPAIVEPFSSSGRTPIFFDATGRRLPRRVLYNKPDVIGPQATDTSFFFPVELDPWSDWDFTGYPNFIGTSAAAPNVAALAALVLQRNKSLQPAELYSRMRAAALNMARPGYDPKTGYGFISVARLLAGCTGAVDGAPCSDGNNCTTGDACLNGVCVGQNVTCPATACTAAGTCDLATGQCTADRKPDGSLCPAPPGFIRNPCVAVKWLCQSGNCTDARFLAPAGRVCNDFDACTTRDRCDGQGNCVGKRVCNQP